MVCKKKALINNQGLTKYQKYEVGCLNIFFFFHPDCNCRCRSFNDSLRKIPGLNRDVNGIADFTADREFHPALKINPIKNETLLLQRYDIIIIPGRIIL